MHLWGVDRSWQANFAGVFTRKIPEGFTIFSTDFEMFKMLWFSI